MIRGRDFHQAAINWCMAGGCTLIVVFAIFVLHLYLRLPFMVPL